ncbi:SDR family oxidoreductase [Chelativorans salis]|uniref:SDR family NAD(P)-dependent oxidoreductase n=1 Tax=Chelativorans salis TaxID=2978478 RepID=A0ABT2LQG4_9HYPH|nr:SDR family NAD(P)-dependent oxidoreductase [Chelativorans sp. EGI FJ00035]MCT7376793.1 SDR family NAD(P)-dependent oxidoreductase [Chelativorans sp. EGI FJ00035]
MKITGNTVLFTGGSSGLGRALAHRFHDIGNEVIVTGRCTEKLHEAIAGRSRMTAYHLEFTDTAEVETFARRVTDDHPRLNLLFNNAGIMRREDVTIERDLSDAEETIEVNLFGPIRVTNALISHLTRQADAAIVNISSGHAFVPLIATPTYSATKAALHSYTVSLREQLKGMVEVIELVPPALRTELMPYQSLRADCMHVDEFVEEAIRLFRRQPTPPEILVERVRFLREAEAENRFKRALAAVTLAEVEQLY